MSDLLRELNLKIRTMQLERPGDINALRKRMGAKKQNASIQIYAYIDLRSTMDVLYQTEKNLLDENCDFKTLVKTVTDWLDFAGGRAPVCFNLHDFSSFAHRIVEALWKETDRKKAAELVRVMQHYTSELSHWLDLEFPWHEVGVAFALAMGDPPPVSRQKEKQ